MTARQLKAALKVLSWNQAQLSRRVKVHENTVSRWMDDPDADVPGPIAAFVELALKVRHLAAVVGA